MIDPIELFPPTVLLLLIQHDALCFVMVRLTQYYQSLLPNRRRSSLGLNQPDIDGDRTLANVVIARDLNLAGHQIQIQALEVKDGVLIAEEILTKR